MRLLQEPVISFEQRIKQEIEENPALDESADQDIELDGFPEEPTLESIVSDEDELRDDTNIIEELEGDSLMLLSLLELVRGRYGLTIALKTLGGHLMKKPANTIGQVVALTLAIVEHGDDIVNVEL